jgi:dipeptidyl aminopeptidase/acylaminoacyl peptidase
MQNHDDEAAGAPGFRVESKVVARRPATRRRRAHWRLAGAIALSLLAAAALAINHGCASWIAHGLVDAPNALAAVSDVIRPSPVLPPGVNQSLRIEAPGPPAASLSLWIMQPTAASDRNQPRGTVLVLHGIRDNKGSQLGTGRTLAAAGYRAVLIDLRGHGESTGDWLTYGFVESRDLQHALDSLQAQNLLTGPVGVVGSSYGGSIGIQFAGVDPRIKAVVAIAPFASVHDLIRCYAQQTGLSWFISDRAIDDGFRQACALTDCDLARVSPVSAAQATSAHLLLIHGRDDGNIPFEHSERLAHAAGDHARLVVLDGEDHVSIMRDDRGVIACEMLDWLSRWLR